MGKWIGGAVAVVIVGQAARLLPRETSGDVSEDRIVSRSMESSSEIEPHLAATLRDHPPVLGKKTRDGQTVKGGQN